MNSWKTHNAYKKENSRDLTYLNFKDKSRFICGEPGWEIVADQILSWFKEKEIVLDESIL